ncbi:kinesin-like protein KIF6 isoform X2 [Triplophysa dalaica]|uniref:kinesin-like protein KIF6 isoform X2 n=1 Tax=Triplophysa dalaica TaxID=1582913 RepID=UPI0024E01648|nr:kinesin-like protein KIF6 isoform X2 [Triplophysa dalaica]
MVKQTIEVFARVKPTKKPTTVYSVDCEDQGDSLEFVVPRDLADGFVNNKKENYKFRFQKVFERTVNQEEIFESIAKPVAENVLSGYNGTIFAYGQTGSGKTFTITGGAERFSDRGIIPRTLTYLYQHISKGRKPEYPEETPEARGEHANSTHTHKSEAGIEPQTLENCNMVYTTHISYLEIYNEAGYDLLNPQHEASRLEDLPRVTIMEDSDQNIHLKNLSLQQSANEEEALDLLFLGDTNRMIAETPMNQASTRSHCIFTIHLCSREPGSATVRRSKLHLVDLAGSERVGKTGVGGQILTEAKYINLSLHYLEQVIIALSEKNRSHIPYRNSMMTSVLRDSLGGNCMTTMIATVSVERRNVDESISTCRFAQRVALIKNDALLNEELDPAVLIVRLKKEIQSLKEELALVTGEQRSDELTQEEIQKVEDNIRMFMEDPDSEATLDVGPDMRKINLCFSLLKARLQDRPIDQNRADDGSSTPFTGLSDEEDSQSHVKKLRDMLIQRDNEISILVSMLKREKRKLQDVTSELKQLHNQNNSSLSFLTPEAEETTQNDTHKDYTRAQHLLTRKRVPDMSVGQQEAFEVFLGDHEDHLTIEDNKTVLKQRFAEAKALGEQVNQIRIRVNELKTELKMRRMQVAAQGVTGNRTESDSDLVEERILNQIEEEKKRYKITFGRLKGLKTEIEHLELLREKSKVKLQRDFEYWWSQQATSQQAHTAEDKVTGQNQTSCMLTWNVVSAFPDPETNKPISMPTRELRASPSADLTSTSIPLTGDKQTDADILSFVRARHKLLNRTGL